MTIAEDIKAAVEQVNNATFPLPCRHLVHPLEHERILPWDRMAEAVAWTPCASLCGAILPLGPKP